MSIEEIKSIPICDVLDELGIDYSYRPSGFKVAVREERTPSCHIYPDNNSFFDYGAGRGGSVIDFVMFVYGCNLDQALRFLECFDLPETAVVPKQRELVDLSDRFYDETWQLSDGARKMMCGKWPALEAGDEDFWDVLNVREGPNALWIPHIGPPNDDGWQDVVGIKVRSLTTWDKVSVKGSTFTSGLYWPQMLAYRPDLDSVTELWLVEGESDAWCMKAVYPDRHVAALPSGAGCWRDEWMEPFTNLLRLHVWFDPDMAGESARDRVIEWAATSGLSTFTWRGRVAEVMAEEVAARG